MISEGVHRSLLGNKPTTPVTYDLLNSFSNGLHYQIRVLLNKTCCSFSPLWSPLVCKKTDKSGLIWQLLKCSSKEFKKGLDIRAATSYRYSLSLFKKKHPLPNISTFLCLHISKLSELCLSNFVSNLSYLMCSFLISSLRSQCKSDIFYNLHAKPHYCKQVSPLLRVFLFLFVLLQTLFKLTLISVFTRK